MVSQELAEFINDPLTVLVVEWGDVINQELPQDRITIEFERVAENQDSRQIKIKFTEKFAYIIEGVTQ